MKESNHKKQSVDFTTHLNEYMHCLTIRYQLEHVYYTGTLDSCEDLRKNFFKFLDSKINKQEEDKEYILSKINERYTRSSEKIWLLKNEPDAPWLEKSNESLS